MARRRSLKPETVFHRGAVVTPQMLIEVVFSQLSRPEVADETLRLFPDGLGALDIDVDTGAGARVSLKLHARERESALGVGPADDDPAILLDGDVQATFNADGHRVIALMARQDLMQRSQKAMTQVQKVLDNGGRDLLAAATFPDDIRNTHPETKPFHFVDLPFEDGGPANPALPPPPHVVAKIAEFTAVLKRSGGSATEKVDALSWLIHLFGDIHQPLHCIEHISALHPAGDRGGNSFRLKGHATNLHSLWDSCVSFTPQDDQTLAQSILQEHSRQQLAAELSVTDVEKWARAGFGLAKQFAYGPLHENPAAPPKPSAAYLKKAEQIGRKQAVLAAYRLSDRLQAIFG